MDIAPGGAPWAGRETDLPFSLQTHTSMKVSKIKTYDQAIRELEWLEANGGIRRDLQNRIIPVSVNAKHIFNRAKELAPSNKRWEKLSPEGASWDESKPFRALQETMTGFLDIRSRSHRQ